MPGDKGTLHEKGLAPNEWDNPNVYAQRHGDEWQTSKVHPGPTHQMSWNRPGQNDLNWTAPHLATDDNARLAEQKGKVVIVNPRRSSI